MPTPHNPSIAVRQTLRKLGSDIRDARRRRHLPAQVLADRAFTSRPTLLRIERGDHAVSIGIYAAILQALGLLGNLSNIAEPAYDEVGLAMQSDRLPQRVRVPKPKGSNHVK